MDEKNYTLLRKKMVAAQLVKRRINDPLTLEAMLHVPRERFIPSEYRSYAYDDRPVPIGEDQTVSQPYMVACMTQALQLRGDETVLEIGTGSGYQTAVLAEIVKHVYSIERLPILARKAKEHLKNLGYTNVTITVGDGTKGDPDRAPFDAVIVTAGSPGVPHSLKEQLAENGRLVIPVGSRRYQELHRVTHRSGSFVTENLGGCIFVPLIGADGWDRDEPPKNLQIPAEPI